jgi:PKD repeat protein
VKRKKMNNKKGKGVIGITLAAIMIASIFAVIAPISADEVKPMSPLEHALGKNTIEGPGGAVNTSLTYQKGDTVYWRAFYMPTSEDVTMLNVTDIYPDGTSEVLFSGSMPIPKDTREEWEMNWTIPSDWPHDKFTNRVRYVVKDKFGTDNTVEASFTSFMAPEKEPPIVKFTWVQVCSNTAGFSGYGYDEDGYFVSHTWDFGDGSALVTKDGPPGSEMHTFPAAGTYTVTLTGCDNDTLCAEYSADVTVVEKCEICKIRVYGKDNKGAGDTSVPEEGPKPEQPPYTDPIAPFYPQHEQAPIKDFITFNPVKMEHRDYDWDNDGVIDYVYKNSIKANFGTGLQDADEKIFFRMWYEPDEWFKDENANGVFDKPDIRAPAIKQEFTYMFLDTDNNPITARAGTSKFLVPMASRTANNGIDSFDADAADDIPADPVVVCSERNLGDVNTDGVSDRFDIDGDMMIEPLNPDGNILSGDETLVLRLDPKTIAEEGRIQFFDFEVELMDTTEAGRAKLNIYYKGNPDSMGDELIGTVNLGASLIPTLGSSFATFERGGVNTALRPRGPGFVWVTDVDWEDDTATIIVGRMFGNTWANVGASAQPFGYQKHFYVDGVLYNVVAIMTDDDDEFKYVTFRVKLPKKSLWIEQHSTQLLMWDIHEILPVMPQYNMNHTMVADVQSTQTYDKHGDLWNVPPLMMYYNKETTEPRFSGELKEILREVCRTTKEPVDILFEIDVTGSMGGEIGEVKASSTAIMSDIRDAIPDSRFGLVSFRDYEGTYECCGYTGLYGSGEPYILESPLTTDTSAVTTAINALSAGGGGDGPEDYTRVLYEAGDDTAIGWRDGAIKIVVMFGDAPTHDCDFYTPDSTGCDPGRNAVAGDTDDLDFETVVADLAAKGVIVLAVDSSESPSPHDPGALTAETVTALEDGLAEKGFRYMADETGGAYRKLTDVDDLPAVVVDLVTSVLPCEEYWQIEWFNTIPDEYTEFFLPKEHGKYLFTSAFEAPESTWTLLDGTYLDSGVSSRLKFWYDESSGPLFIEKDGLRIYGYDNKGAGDTQIVDPVYKIKPENPPYTDPIAPFYPQHEQAPIKDFITFNPVKMEHQDYDWDNDDVIDYVYKNSIKAGLKNANEKEFFRMWYEPWEWFKDENANGVFDGGDIAAPAIKQEFTYMFLDTYNNPITAPAGTSKFLVPMSSGVEDNGIDSFDADDDGKPDPVWVCSERNLGDPNNDGLIDRYDIDGDGKTEPLSWDGKHLSGDETLVLRLDPKTIDEEGRIQFFDFEVEVADTTPAGRVTLNIYYKGNPDSMGDELIGTVNLRADMIPNPGVSYATFERGGVNTALRPRGPGFVWVTDVDWEDDTATLVVGRVFGNTWANVGATEHPLAYQKHFYVDGVLYNVVAIMTVGEDEFKYITFRVKLPKTSLWIEQHSTQLLGWYASDTLPVMPQYNMNHALVQDVQDIVDLIGTHEKHGPLMDAQELNITYTEEKTEPRFRGELKEILLEPGYYPWEEGGEEWWFIEWFNTIPYQYTKFQLPEGHGKYLVTSAFYAPEATWTIWDGAGETSPIDSGIGNRVKFWYDPADNTDIYVNRYGEGPEAPETISEYYDNGDKVIDLDEVIDAIMDYLNEDYPFGFDGRFDKDSLIDYIMDYLKQEGYI